MYTEFDHHNQSDSANTWLDGFSLQLSLMNAVLVLAMCLGGAYVIYSDYNRRLVTANQHALDAAMRYHDNAWLIMSGIDSTFRATLEWLDRQDDTDGLNEYLSRTAASYPFVRTIIVVLPNGDIIGDSRPDIPAVGVNIADREYFRSYVDNQITGLDIIAPVMSRVDGAWSTPVGRGTYDEDGNLQWYVNAAFDPVNFAELFIPEEISHIDQGFILNDRGDILATIPFDGNLLTASSQAFESIQDHISFNTSGYFQGDTLLGDGQSIIAYQRAQEYPLTVITQIQLATILQPVFRNAIITTIVVLSLSIITTFITYYQIKSERRRRQEMIFRQQREKEIRTLAENVNDIIVRFDRDLRHVYVNSALLRATGLTVQDYLGKTNRQLAMPEEQVTFWDRETRLVFETKKENIIEFEYEGVDGKRYFQGHLTPEFDVDGNVATVLSVVRDITTLKHTQQTLEKQKQRLTIALEAAGAGLWEWDIVGNHTIWDERSEKIHGLEPGTFASTYEAWYELVHPDDVEQVNVDMSTNGDDLNSVTAEYRVVCPDRTIRHILSQAIILHDDVNNPIRMIGVHIDVTQRKVAEQIAIQERNLLRTVIDNIPDFIFVKDTESRFIETNQAHASAAGVSRDEMIGCTATELFDTEVAQQFHADDVLILQEGQSIINQEQRTTDVDGDQRWVLTTKVPLHDDKGKISGLIGISRDITERRQAEIERKETEKIQLEIEQERQLLELKEQFIATVSHNFRTPLAIISSGKSLLYRYLERYTPDEQREKLDKIQMQVDHMTRLLNETLTLNQLNAGKVNLVATQFDLKALCQHIWDDMELLDADQHPKDFQYLAQETLIVADESILQQIIHNLLSNAFKYTPDGQSITFKIDSDDRWFILSVKDNGIGIPESEQSQLFHPFNRASNASAIQGTGLGLVIIKEYVELHQGQLTFKSEEGEGTTFTVRLPLNPSDSS